jgi:hypothetical protein
MCGLYYRKFDTTLIVSEWSRKRVFFLIKLVKETINVHKNDKQIICIMNGLNGGEKNIQTSKEEVTRIQINDIIWYIHML